MTIWQSTVLYQKCFKYNPHIGPFWHKKTTTKKSCLVIKIGEFFLLDPITSKWSLEVNMLNLGFNYLKALFLPQRAVSWHIFFGYLAGVGEKKITKVLSKMNLLKGWMGWKSFSIKNNYLLDIHLNVWIIKER